MTWANDLAALEVAVAPVRCSCPTCLVVLLCLCLKQIYVLYLNSFPKGTLVHEDTVQMVFSLGKMYSLRFNIS